MLRQNRTAESMKIIAIIGIIAFAGIFAILADGVQTNLNYQPTTIHKFGIYLWPGGGHWVKTETDDGSIVILEDDSVWGNRSPRPTRHGVMAAYD
jgi:hypothetical protein